MPLTPELQARLQKRGIVGKGGRRILITDNDTYMPYDEPNVLI